VIKRPKRTPPIPSYMTADIEAVDPNGVSDLLGDTVFIAWCIGGVGYGAASIDLTGWLLTHFLIESKNEWILYMHNAFGFDFKRVDFERLANQGITGSFLAGNDGRIKMITFRKGEWTWQIRDSLLLLPMTLAKATKTFAPEYAKLERDSFEYRSFDVTNQEDVDYAIRDAVGLYYAIEGANDVMEEHFEVSIHAAPTLPGLAFRAFKLVFNDGEEYPGVSFGVAFAARAAYHGGQTVALNTKTHYDEVSIDCNSMYVHVMRTWLMPTGVVKHRVGLPTSANVDTTLVFAVGFIPENVFPYLKTKDHKGHTGNYNGLVAGWYWLFEVEKQTELGGHFEIMESYVWAEQTDVAKRFGDKCHDLRMMDYNGPIGQVSKTIGNSSYGKLAQRTVEKEIIMDLSEPEGAIPMYHPEAEDLVPYLWYVDSRPNFSADMVHWASYITARARFVLVEAMQQVGIKNVDYCDTDSLFFERQYLDSAKSLLGPEYGQFKIEKEMFLFQAVAAKSYRRREIVELKEERNGKPFLISKQLKLFVNNKGIPKRVVSTHQYFKKFGQAGLKAEFVMTHNLKVMLENPKGGYGKMTSRKLATTESTTNGKITAEVWEAVPCILPTLSEMLGREASWMDGVRYQSICEDAQAVK